MIKVLVVLAGVGVLSFWSNSVRPFCFFGSATAEQYHLRLRFRSMWTGNRRIGFPFKQWYVPLSHNFFTSYFIIIHEREKILKGHNLNIIKRKEIHICNISSLTVSYRWTCTLVARNYVDLLHPCSHSAERMVNERLRQLNDVYVSGCFTSQLLKNLGSKIPCISYCTDTDCIVSNTNRYLPIVHIHNRPRITQWF